VAARARWPQAGPARRRRTLCDAPIQRGCDTLWRICRTCWAECLGEPRKRGRKEVTITKSPTPLLVLTVR